MTLQDVKEYLKIDDSYEDVFLSSLMTISEDYITSMVGEGYKTNEKAVNLAGILQLKLISDMYENRGTETSTKGQIKRDRVVTSILDKLSIFNEVQL